MCSTKDVVFFVFRQDINRQLSELRDKMCKVNNRLFRISQGIGAALQRQDAARQGAPGVGGAAGVTASAPPVKGFSATEGDGDPEVGPGDRFPQSSARVFEPRGLWDLECSGSSNVLGPLCSMV